MKTVEGTATRKPCCCAYDDADPMLSTMTITQMTLTTPLPRCQGECASDGAADAAVMTLILLMVMMMMMMMMMTTTLILDDENDHNVDEHEEEIGSR